jgi:hypothetical protein
MFYCIRYAKLIKYNNVSRIFDNKIYCKRRYFINRML